MFKCEVRSPSFLLSKSFLDAICRAQPGAGCKCLWERLVWKQITSCTFSVTLWQKMLVILPVTFPLAVLTTSEVYPGCLEADMSENHPAISSVKWEVLPFLVCKSSLDVICRARPRAVCKYIWERLVWKQITSCTFTSKYWVEHSWITLAYDSNPSIIGLSQDMWHCGRRRL